MIFRTKAAWSAVPDARSDDDVDVSGSKPVEQPGTETLDDVDLDVRRRLDVTPRISATLADSDVQMPIVMFPALPRPA